MQTLFLRKPDDWHVHLRDNDVLKDTVVATASTFARALVMPNLKPALTALVSLEAYHERIRAISEGRFDFTPYLTFYLNQDVCEADLRKARNYPYILGAKFYPAGATTNSAEGARSLKLLYPLLGVMQEEDLVLQIHGEVTHGDIFEREALFIDEVLKPLVRDFPKLRIVLEHISTKSAVEFVKQAKDTVSATITPHHLFFNRNHLLEGGVKPHYYCLPILKHASDQYALQQAVISGNPKFFAGTDSAPHTKSQKESACGCAGIYSAPFALAMYAEVFDELGHLHRLDDFMSAFGANFYKLPLSNDHIELIKKPQVVPESLPLGPDTVVPVAAGTPLQWSIHDIT